MEYSSTEEIKPYATLSDRAASSWWCWQWDRNIRILTEAVDKMGRLIEGVRHCPRCSKLLLKTE